VPVRLTQTEIDRVLVFNVAEMARRRRSRGLLLNHPEAVALITDEMMELAREGRGYSEVTEFGQRLLTTADVLPGVAVLARGLVCEPMFDDGARIIVLADPIAGEDTERPGARFLAAEPITVNAGRDVVTLIVRNGSNRVVNISSHYHFYEINPRMEFDRDASYGRHLDIQAGRSLIWEPGETHHVDLVRYAGDGYIDGFQLVPPPIHDSEA